MNERTHALRTLALKLNVSGTAEVLNEQRLYKGSYGFIKMVVYVPKTENTNAPVCSVFCTSIDIFGVEQISSRNYPLWYDGEVELNGAAYLVFERPLPKEFTEKQTVDNGLHITINYYDTVPIVENGQVVLDENGVPARRTTDLLVSSRYTTTVYAGGFNEEGVELSISSAEAAQINDNAIELGALRNEMDIMRADFSEKVEQAQEYATSANEAKDSAISAKDSAMEYKNVALECKDTAVQSAEQATQSAREAEQVVAQVFLEGGFSLDLSLDDDYVLTVSLKNKEGSVVSTQSVDFPIESLIVNAEYSNKILTITLQNGTTRDINIADIVSGLVPDTRKINNKPLSSDVTLTAEDVGAYAKTETYTQSEVDTAISDAIANVAGGGGGQELGYDKYIRTQQEFYAMIHSNNWLGAKSVLLVGNEDFLSDITITIPESVKRLDGINGATIKYVRIDDDNYLTGYVLSKATLDEDFSMSNITINANYASTDGCYRLCNLTNVTITGDGADFAYTAFYNCKNLTNCSVTVNSGGTTAFANCKNLINCSANCYAGDGYSYIYSGCTNLINCSAISTYASEYEIGFYGCSYGSNCYTNVQVLNCTNFNASGSGASGGGSSGAKVYEHYIDGYTGENPAMPDDGWLHFSLVITNNSPDRLTSGILDSYGYFDGNYSTMYDLVEALGFSFNNITVPVSGYFEYYVYDRSMPGADVVCDMYLSTYQGNKILFHTVKYDEYHYASSENKYNLMYKTFDIPTSWFVDVSERVIER